MCDVTYLLLRLGHPSDLKGDLLRLVELSIHFQVGFELEELLTSTACS
jgi:hypothetical protein